METDNRSDMQKPDRQDAGRADRDSSAFEDGNRGEDHCMDSSETTWEAGQAADARGRKRKKNREEEPEEKETIGQIIWEYVRMLGVMIIVVLLLQTFLIVNARIPSASMEPTVMTGDQIFGNRLAYKNSDPERYDIIIFHYPDDESKLFIKRVIGLPGETVDIRDGEVYIDGSSEPLYDDFCMTPGITDTGKLTFPITVPEGSYFVLGDNRAASMDSRYWNNTFVKKEKILGEAVLRYWPLTRISRLRGYEP